MTLTLPVITASEFIRRIRLLERANRSVVRAGRA
eukprot:CAMPEP_0182845558 /NCGR_PEP_ID=MMETSP0006_2-20121128/27400_1 /TAXON_ID=97485 /ORGANISM="Prymnesium parvum, Strain Texoma1" /LENGTH=33 /DNA_ID= /DNA_START= /DNA_END= /DNA_ORIENTATION=